MDAERHPEAAEAPGSLVFRVESGLFFANADHVRAAVRALLRPGTRRVVFDGQTTPWVDVTGAETVALLRRDLARDRIDLHVVHPVGQVRDVLDRTSAGADRFPVSESVDAALVPDGSVVPPRDEPGAATGELTPGGRGGDPSGRTR